MMDTMTTIPDGAAEVAREVTAGTAEDRLLERLAELIGARANINAVFGEPVSRGDVMVVPVARVRWGFGGGAGQSTEAPAGPASGSGAGGGVWADPIGYIEVSASGAEFRPIRDPYPSPAFLVGAGVTTAIVLGALRRLVRR